MPFCCSKLRSKRASLCNRSSFAQILVALFQLFLRSNYIAYRTWTKWQPILMRSFSC